MMISKYASLAHQTQFIIKSPKDVKSILLHAQVDKFMIEAIRNVFVQLTNLIGMEDNASAVLEVHNGILKNYIV